MSSENVVETDVLVIGGATAGCFAAIKARELGLDVTMVDKACAGKSGASIAAGGWWAVFNVEWGNDWDACMNEVKRGAENLNNRDWSEIILKESWATYQDLVAWGVEFPAAPDKLKDYWNQQITRGRTNGRWPPPHDPTNPYTPVPIRHRKTTPFLRRQAEKVGVKVMDRIMITDLLKQDGKVVGAIGFPTDSYDLYIFKAKATVLSAGNSGFKPPGHLINSVTGDADGMAYRAGAEVAGKEFPDGHTTQGPYPAWKSGELYPAYFYYTDAEGREITSERYGIQSMPFVIHDGRGPVLYDLDAAIPEDVAAMQEYIRKRGNTVELKRIGLDVTRGGKYQMMGGAAAGRYREQTTGIWPVNIKCASSLPGLYAAGDCCATWCTTLGGLTPSAVTGKRAGAGAAEYALQMEKAIIDEEKLAGLKRIMYAPAERRGGFSPRWVTQLLQNTMMPYFILYIKHGERLQAALTVVEFLREHLVPQMVAKDPHELRLAHETKNMVLTAEIILRSSLFRAESRAGHYREDYPERDDPAWLAWVKIKEEQGRMKLWKEPIPKEWWPDLSKT
jgi:succinate dehydrogenase/fumarate reductase flavoprotein subunit